MRKKTKQENLAFEESLGDEWSRDFGIVEVPLGEKPLIYLGAAIFFIAAVFLARVFYLNVFLGDFYFARAQSNATKIEKTPAPRGLIYERSSGLLAGNKIIWSAILDTKEFLRKSELENKTLEVVKRILDVSNEEVLKKAEESSEGEFFYPAVLASNISQEKVVQLKGADLSTLVVKQNFERVYDGGSMFSSVVGYTGRVSPEDLKKDPGLSGEDFIGRAGVESFYNGILNGEKGVVEKKRDAEGKFLSEEVKDKPRIGEELHLTIDGEFQEFFYSRLRDGLASLGRRIGIGLALDPRNGEVLALVNLPGFDSNIFMSSGDTSLRVSLLNSKDKPLFNRVTSGLYNPGSTIKPLVALAALKEKVIAPDRVIFSPGYLDIPNPYIEGKFSRYRDWRYQGRVDLSSAIAQSSNVYFYAVGGGLPAGIDKEILAGGGYIGGLGINRLRDWWGKFMFGRPTGIDLPGEASGLLPSPEWKEENIGGPWLLGDTYNVSIGQGDFLVTPLQLLNYISAIANGGKIWKLRLNLETKPELLADIPDLESELSEVKKGMVEAVTSPLGTAHLLNDLGLKIAAKTGTVQVLGGAQENAIFVGYFPAEVSTRAGVPVENPQLAILILVENAVEGSLNTVPIAKDLFNWYYWNRIAK